MAHRHTILLTGVLLTMACDGPSGPSAEARRAEQLLNEPGLAVSPARDSVFSAEMGPWRFSSRLGTPGLRAIRDADTWLATWDSITYSVSPRPEAPAVDFQREMVVIAAHGAAPTLGYSIAITHVTTVHDTLFVLAERTRPGAACVTGQAITAPVAARLLPRVELPAVLLSTQYVFDCATRTRRPER